MSHACIGSINPIFGRYLSFFNGAGLMLGWARALVHWYPWQADDGIPNWREERDTNRQRLAA